GFVIGKIIDSLIIGFLCYFGMLILRLPYPVLVATVVGVTNVIPFFGPIIGAVPCGFLILLVNPLQCFYFVIFVICLQQLDGNVIGPKILGNTIGISGFWVLVSITVAAGLFGFAGMLLGVPVFAIIYMLISDSVNLLLKKKGDTTATDAYYAIERVSDLEQGSAVPAGEAPADAEAPAEAVPAAQSSSGRAKYSGLPPAAR
ncbi:MAG: AI-2E family transporter, partial [Clostridiales bacterium]|nr:AI-2E family transporter [Clostridiales bacterium]